MGFFSKIKQGFNQMVGNTGTMQITVDKQQAHRGETVEVTAVLTATNQVQIKSINFEVVATETIKYQVPVTNSSNTSGTSTNFSTNTTQETKDNQTYDNKQVINGVAFAMNQGETHTYTGTVQIPQVSQATYRGVDAVHVWKIRAFADVPMGGDIAAEVEINVL
jgi:hypothetical protein